MDFTCLPQDLAEVNAELCFEHQCPVVIQPAFTPGVALTARMFLANRRAEVPRFPELWKGLSREDAEGASWSGRVC